MLKVGDKLLAKPKFLIKYQLQHEQRELIVSYLEKSHHNDGFKIILSHGNEQVFNGGLFSIEWIIENFYLTNNLNYEVTKVLESIEIKSFNAVTVDGKVINMELT